MSYDCPVFLDMIPSKNFLFFLNFYDKIFSKNENLKK